MFIRDKRNQQELEANKGTVLRVTAGSFQGMNCWEDKKREKHNKLKNGKGILSKFYIIVEQDDGKLRGTWTKPTSVRPFPTAPGNRAEQLFYHKCKVDALLDSLCQEIASAEIKARDDDIDKVFKERRVYWRKIWLRMEEPKIYRFPPIINEMEDDHTA